PTELGGPNTHDDRRKRAKLVACQADGTHFPEAEIHKAGLGHQSIGSHSAYLQLTAMASRQPNFVLLDSSQAEIARLISCKLVMRSNVDRGRIRKSLRKPPRDRHSPGSPDKRGPPSPSSYGRHRSSRYDRRRSDGDPMCRSLEQCVVWVV